MDYIAVYAGDEPDGDGAVKVKKNGVKSHVILLLAQRLRTCLVVVKAALLEQGGFYAINSPHADALGNITDHRYFFG